jgi:hypothetical protein
LVGATFVSVFSTEILTKLKVYEMEDLREEGRIEASRLARYTRQKVRAGCRRPNALGTTSRGDILAASGAE